MKSSMNVKANQQGFTLIELVVVIVILGILAVTAAPKFIDLTGDAKSSTMEAVKGSLSSVADMAHAKALVQGHTGGLLSIAGQNINFVASYPDVEAINLLMDINATNSVGGGDFFITITAGDNASYTHPTATDAANCVAVYNETADSDIKPVITSTTTGC